MYYLPFNSNNEINSNNITNGDLSDLYYVTCLVLYSLNISIGFCLRILKRDSQTPLNLEPPLRPTKWKVHGMKMEKESASGTLLSMNQVCNTTFGFSDFIPKLWNIRSRTGKCYW